jgi:metal-sulfur cluster biosynthetic enzyme
MAEPAPTPAAGTAAQVDLSTADLETRVWHELRQCFDPEIPVNIVELGLVYAMRSEPLPAGGHRVEVLMTVTSPGCGMSEILRNEAELRIGNLPGVREVVVAITFDPPWTPERMSDEARLLLNL